MLGPGRTIADLITAQEAIETLYRNAGFGAVLVNIPEQNVEADVAQLSSLRDASRGSFFVSRTPIRKNAELLKAAGLTDRPRPITPLDIAVCQPPALSARENTVAERARGARGFFFASRFREVTRPTACAR